MIEPLHLTEDNREALRALVRQITPQFEEELWNKVNLHHEELLRQKQEAQAAMAQQQARMAQQTASTIYGGAAGAVGQIFTTTGTVSATGGPFTISNGALGGGLNTATTNASVPYYQPVGTGFTSYGPIDPNQGLTLKK
jgi:hypothetical protein